MSDNEIVVYYSFHKRTDKKNLNIEPNNLLKYLLSIKNNNNNDIFFCPSIIERVKQIFYFNALEDISIDKNLRKTSGEVLDNGTHFLLEYQLLMFSLTPLNVLISDPFFHSRKNVGFFAAPSMLDINQKFRPIQFSFIAFSDKLKILKDEPLLYLEFLTNKKIVFKSAQLFDKHFDLIDVFDSEAAGECKKYKSLKENYFNFQEKKEKLITLFKEEYDE
jgi:hypothetical protein